MVHAWLHWNLLHRLLSHAVINVLVGVHLEVVVVILPMHVITRYVLAILGTVAVPLARRIVDHHLLLLLLLHLTIQLFSLPEYLQQLVVDLIAVQLLQYVFLMLELILRLLRLLSSHLLLDQGIGILRLLLLLLRDLGQVLTVTLGAHFVRILVLLSHGLVARRVLDLAVV